MKTKVKAKPEPPAHHPAVIDAIESGSALSVGELKILLAQYRDDMLVVLSRDCEGSEIHVACDLLPGVYKVQRIVKDAMPGTVFVGEFESGPDDDSGYEIDEANAIGLFPVD